MQVLVLVLTSSSWLPARKDSRNADPAGQFVWQRESASLRETLGVAPDVRPWTGRSSFKGRGLPRTARVLDLLDLFVMQKCREKRVNFNNAADLAAVMQDQYIDVSQSLSRNSHTNKAGWNHALTTGSILYSFSRDAVLTGREMLQLHGQPATLSLPCHLREGQISQLAGEGMACPCLAAILWCLFLCKQFPEQRCDGK